MTLVTRTTEQLAGDLRQVHELVERKPGRAANYYAVKLNLPHAYARKLLAQLEQLGELKSRTVRVYRVAVRP